MSKFKSHATKSVAEHSKFQENAVENFMGGTSYKINPLDTLKIVSASSIFGESSYYRSSHDKKSGLKSVEPRYDEPKDSTTDIFTKAIDDALDFDFKGTLDLAVELRDKFYMRLNPGVIMVRAALHKDRAEFNKKNLSTMRDLGCATIKRPDDITNQFEYYMFLNGTKNKLPNILKRIWADKLGSFDRYQISKYQSKGLRDLIRISHANSEVIDELMKLQSGVLKLDDESSTWERLKSEGKTWKAIWTTMGKIPHMALTRNLRGIFSEINDLTLAQEILGVLKGGVANGNQFPFRYWTTYKAIEEAAGINHEGLILDTLEECIDIAMVNFPKLTGKTMCLSDNSGSAWGAVTTEYGSTYVAEIGNLSSIMTGYNSDEGYVGYFGDRLVINPVSKRNGVLSQLNQLRGRHGIGSEVGGGTENGIWIFFRDAIKNKEHYDNIFIYSDQQAGHGGLYGIDASEYSQYRYKNNNHIDVLMLVQDYRTKVNPKVNLFSVQTAGYNNSVLPENLYRVCVLTGWTGSETTYAQRMIQIWNDIESRNS